MPGGCHGMSTSNSSWCNLETASASQQASGKERMTNPFSSFSPGKAAAMLNWQQLWMIGSRHLRLFLSCFIPVVLLAIVYIIKSPRIYQSTAVVQVEQQEQRTPKSIDKETE